MEGAPKFAESQTLPDVDYAAFARSLGLQGINVDTADGVGPAWDAALAADRPTRARRPLRPRRAADPAARHVRAGQGRPCRRVLHGDEDTAGFVKQGLKQKVQQYLPGTKEGD